MLNNVEMQKAYNKTVPWRQILFLIVFTINVPANTIRNKNSGTTITIGVDETDGNENETAPEGGVVVDAVDPIWEKVSASPDSGELVISARDKSLDSVSLGDGNIIVYVKKYGF